jgi:sigma-B regulation protein RsbU (phosphoserine phosphatase)
VNKDQRYQPARWHGMAATLAAGLFGVLLFAGGQLLLLPEFYHPIHLSLGFAAVVVCWLVALQGWAVFPHTLSTERLMMGALFFSAGALFSVHFVLSFTEDDVLAALFSLAARFTLAWGLLFLFSRPD